MTIEQLYKDWQTAKVEEAAARDDFHDAAKTTEVAEQNIYKAIYAKRETHLRHYGEHMIRSGNTIFTFEFTGKNGASASIQNFKVKSIKCLDPLK